MILLAIILAISLYLTGWLITDTVDCIVNNKKMPKLAVLLLGVSLCWSAFFYLAHYTSP